MTEFLRCCPPETLNEPYIGVDELCSENAIFCIEHTPHKNTEGLMHQMLPLKHFKRTLHEKKFRMNEKISVLIDQYNNLMDSLIAEIHELKLKKNIELSMLWLRELAKDQEEYELMRKIYRSDFEGLTCQRVHSIYFKIIHNQILERKSVHEIDCYKGISEVLEHLSLQKQTRAFLGKKIAEIEGLLENGEILKRALPDKAVLKENIKEVLLQSPHEDYFQIKYNKCKIQAHSRQYVSVFSKYPLIPHLVYHVNFQAKYSNVMIGVCSKSLKERRGIIEESGSLSQSQGLDLHYSKDSIVFNCTNGCVYKDGMFESGSNLLTKGLKSIVLKLRVTENELIVMMGKHVLCREKIQNLAHNRSATPQSLFLHILLRNKGDSFEVDRDREVSADELRTVQKLEDHILSNQNELDRSDEQEETMNGKLTLPLNTKRQQDQEVELVNDIQEDLKRQIIKKEIECQKGHLREEVGLNQPTISEGNTECSKKAELMKFEEVYKQKKINELIKKERIEKILQDIKSKPTASGLNARTDIQSKIEAKRKSNENHKSKGLHQENLQNFKSIVSVNNEVVQSSLLKSNSIKLGNHSK